MMKHENQKNKHSSSLDLNKKVDVACLIIILESVISSRRPVLEGDNWWRGHAAAFLKYANLSPESLRRGRVCQVIT